MLFQQSPLKSTVYLYRASGDHFLSYWESNFALLFDIEISLTSEVNVIEKGQMTLPRKTGVMKKATELTGPVQIVMLELQYIIIRNQSLAVMNASRTSRCYENSNRGCTHNSVSDDILFRNTRPLIILFHIKVS